MGTKAKKTSSPGHLPVDITYHRHRHQQQNNMRFFISSVFVTALLSSDMIAVDAKLRGANKKVIHRKLTSTTEGSTESSDVSAESSESSESSPTSGSARRKF